MCLYYISSTSVEGLLHLLAVSTRWSSLILNTPLLWASIVIGEGGGDELVRIHTFLHLSRDQLLDIVVRGPATFLDGIDALMPHAQRIRSLAIRTSPTDQETLVRCFMEGAPSFSQMQILNVEGGNHHLWQEMLKICPNLRVIRGMLAPSGEANMHNLEEVSTSLESLGDALSVTRAGNLTYLALDYSEIQASNAQWTSHIQDLGVTLSRRLHNLKVMLNFKTLAISFH